MAETRRLATILSLDVAGYSRAAERDDAAAAQTVRSVRAMIAEIVTPLGGRIFSSAGDGFMLEFPAATAGVQAALALLKESATGAQARPQIRIGLHLGEVMVEANGDLLGHGVNVAARLQTLADPGSALVSEAVRSQVRTSAGLPFTPQGRVQLDKMSENIAVYALNPGPAVLLSKISRRRVTRGLLIGGAVAAPLAGIAAWRLSSSGAAANSAPALAALPFSNLTGRPEDAAFAAGLHDDLLTRMARVSAIRVIARTSVLGYAGSTKRASEIASELGVNAVLAGSVQRSGDRLRVAVQLVDADTDSQTWGETYDRALTADNLFEIQREITEAIAHALNTVLTAREMTAAFAGGTHSLEAYEAFARGRIIFSSVDFLEPEQVADLILAFDQAIAADPNFASAHAQKAYALICAYWHGQFREGLDPALRDAARAALDRAVALAPDGADTHIARAAYFYWGFLDYDQALRYLRKARRMAPNDVNISLLKAFVTRRDGRFAASSAAFDQAILLDPQNAQAMAEHALLLGAIGSFSQAESLIARALAIDPTSPNIRYLGAWIQLNRGDAARAWADFREVRSVLQSERVFFAICTRRRENINFALDDWPTDLRQPESFPVLYEISRAQALLALGQPNEARRILLQVKADLDASSRPYPDGWYGNILPCVVPGLLGDLAGVRAAERDFLTMPRDEFQKRYIFAALAEAFQRSEDSNRACHYIEEGARFFGPSFYLRISVDPSFDTLRNHRRYLALKRRYEAWAEGRR